MRIKWFSFVRITGLLLVLLYHFFKKQFPGGFIGVDIFFTFSGYLITALLLDEYSRNHKIDIIGFFRRRFYRIVPPMVLMVLITLPFTLLIKTDFRAGIGNQIAATFGFMTNVYEIMTGGNYEAQFVPHLFVHTWSLAIEVHFYIVWGLLLWFLGKRVKNSKQYRGVVFMVSSSLFLAGFLAMFISSFFVHNFSSIYFSTWTHSFPFFLGSVFATMTGIQNTTKRFKKNVRLWKTSRVVTYVLGSFALLFLLSLILDFDHLFTYLFGFVLSSLFASVMIYSCRVLSDQTSIKEPAFVTYLADTSYGVYLFHWPFYVIFSQMLSNTQAVMVTVLLSYLFATLSFYVLEPLIAGKSSHLFRWDFDLRPYSKWIYTSFAALGILMLFLTTVSPKMGEFETNLLVSSLNQSNDQMRQTRNLADKENIGKTGSQVLIIGDSVALSSSGALSQYLPNAQQDSAVSRNFDLAFDIFENHIKNETLPETVVIAVGVNSVYDYKDDTQQFIDALPKGHHLVFVTPYNGKENQAAVKEARDYELTLAKKYNYITIADWYKVAVDHPEIWPGTDGVHYKDNGSDDSEGGKLYAQTLQAALKKAAKAPAKGEK